MKALNKISRFLAPSALAIALGVGFSVPAAPVHAQDDLTRAIVDIADVVFRAGVPYYRYGDYGRYDRLVVQSDRYGRPVYYRYVPVRVSAYPGAPHGNAYGYRGRDDDRYYRDVDCNKHGKCKVTYYDGRHDRRHDGRWWDGHRWHDDD
ncbi:DUF4148 domain-containing protein [Pseudoluteimonas lycopersici]|uniref:DUF4148 domain-containing protein n=1 Tax=Pseudoluteimonas lycopersici TaxID=1324796 RepID=A0A516V759_9GAMM|nr:DUF4148 domain-containing protein [Lysobacter lycopersici]QDQ74350.1 DUF4148 domain-containing protein [Lysobacter lycopersici]